MTITHAKTKEGENVLDLNLVRHNYAGVPQAAQQRPLGPQTDAHTINILLDLKPTLDGYAGIPQEARLLFRDLRRMDGYDVDGLIQHGARRLRSAVPLKKRSMPVSKRINRLSRVVVSVYQNPYGSIFEKIANGIQSYFGLALLRLRLLTRRAITPGVFESDLFDDFIWRTFFSKTLKPIDKALITSARYRILATPKKLLHQAALAGLRFSSTPRYALVNTKGFDVFVAQTPFPARVSRGTQMVVRYHDAVPILMPHTINDKAFHQASHFYALQENVRAGAWFSCISEATRSDLVKIFPEVEPRTSVIHNIVSDEYFEEESSKGLICQILPNRLANVSEFGTDLSSLRFEDLKTRRRDFDYLLMVSTLEPRKNHALLLSAWERLKFTSMPDLKLVIVGSKGWDYKPILDAFRPWAERGDLFYLNNIPSSELRVLYKHAAATICPSLAEGFDYTGVEAMRSGGIVISSDIPVHREIYENASVYFDPYSVEDAALTIRRVIGAEGALIRARMRDDGRNLSERYTSRNILPKWNEFFQMLKRTKDALASN